MAVALPPTALIRCSVSSALARSAMMICAPSSAKRTADAYPMPDAAPDITAVLPWCFLLIPRSLHFLAARLLAWNGFAGEALCGGRVQPPKRDPIAPIHFPLI